MKKFKILSLLLSSALVLSTATNIFATDEENTNLNSENSQTLIEDDNTPPASDDDTVIPEPGNPDDLDGTDPDLPPSPIEGGNELVPGEEENEESEEGGETSEESTEEVIETEESAEEALPVILAPIYTAPIPTLTQSPNTNRPSDIQRVPTQPTTPQITTEETDNEEEEIDLLEGHYIVFNWNIFTSEEEAQELIDLIEEDEDAQDQLEYELEEMSENFYLVRVSYVENADPQGKWVLFYVSTMFKTPEEAQDYMDYNLNIYPDIFFAAEVIEVGEYYNVIYGIRVKADTQAVTYDEESFEVDYLTEREEFTYTVKADEETGEFVDSIPEAVEEAFPGEFTFSQEEISDDKIEVTMTPVKTEDAELDVDTEVEEATEEEIVE